MNKNQYKPGAVVLCIDNENVEFIVRENRTYTISEVSHRGVLLKLKGVPSLLASVRFVPLDSQTSTPPEMAHASNQ